MKSRSRRRPGSVPQNSRRGPPPRMPPRQMQRPVQRRVLPPQPPRNLPPSRTTKPSKLQKEFDQTLKKLKDIGK